MKINLPRLYLVIWGRIGDQCQSGWAQIGIRHPSLADGIAWVHIWTSYGNDAFSHHTCPQLGWKRKPINWRQMRKLLGSPIAEPQGQRVRVRVRSRFHDSARLSLLSRSGKANGVILEATDFSQPWTPMPMDLKLYYQHDFFIFGGERGSNMLMELCMRKENSLIGFIQNISLLIIWYV